MKMGKKLCWICGSEIKESAPIDKSVYFGEISVVHVRKPYATNWKWKPAYICQQCMHDKIGVTYEGENINPSIAQK
jgi:hypothetical protein